MPSAGYVLTTAALLSAAHFGVHDAMPYARAAVFVRELEVSLRPGSGWEQWPTSTTTRWRGCRQLRARRVRCRYEFTMTMKGFTIYGERGRIDVTPKRTHLVTLEVPSVRERPPGYR